MSKENWYQHGLFSFNLVQSALLNVKYRYESHSGCIGALASSESLLLSGSSDEIIRLGHLYNGLVLISSGFTT